jgi:UDP-glucose 4-epimerase
VPAGAEFHRLGIGELRSVLGEWHVEAVIHFAAKSLVAESVEHPERYWNNNVVGSVALLDAMRAAGVTRIVFSSTAATYGAAVEMPIREDAPAAPTNPYGASKLAVDMALRNYAGAYGLTTVSLRYFNVAGALHTEDGHSYGERHATETHLIPLALRAAAGGGATLSLYGTDYPTPDGTCVRDYIHVVDLGDAHLRALGVGDPGDAYTINLGSGTGYSVRQVLDTVSAVTSREVPVVEADRRAGDPPTLIASNERAGSLLDWHPTRDLRQMVADAWEFAQQS